MSDKKIIAIKKRVDPIVSKAQAIEVVNEARVKTATEMLSQLNQVKDKVTTEKEKITKPLNEALKAERARWKPIETIYEEAIGIIRTKIGKYQTEIMRKQREEEAKIADKVAKGTIKMDTALSKLEAIDEPNKAIKTESGLIKFREVEKLKIVDEAKIPRKYLVPNEKAILEDLKNGKKVAGCELETVSIPLNYR